MYKKSVSSNQRQTSIMLSFNKTAKFIYFILLFTAISSICAQNQSESDDFSYALKLYEKNFYDLAAQQFIRYVNNHPNSPKLDEAGYYAGMSLYKLGEFENARIEFQSVAVNFPKSKRASESWFMCGECYLKLDNIEEAAKAFEAVKTLYPKQANAALSALKAAEQYKKIGLREKADQLLTLIQDRYIESSAYYPSLILQGKLYFENGKLGRAKNKFEKLLKVKADKNLQAEALFMLGQIAEQQGYSRDASQFYNMITSEYKNSTVFIPASLTLAKITIKTGDYSAAQNILRSGLKREPDPQLKNEMNELLGDAHFLDQQYALALKAYENCEDHADNHIKNRRELKIALSWYQQKNINKAIGVLEKSVRSLPDTLDIYLNLSLQLYLDWLEESGKHTTAIETLYQLRASPHFSNKLKSRLIAFLQNENKWQDIISELEHVLKSNAQYPEKDDFVYTLAYAYEQLNNYKESTYYYQKLLMEFPSSQYIQNAKDNLNYINNYYPVNESFSIKKLALLIGDILNSENKGKLQFQLGKIYFESLKDYSNAIVQFKQALNAPENSKNLAEINYYIGRSFQMKADEKWIQESEKSSYLAEAKVYFSKAMEQINSAANPDMIASAFVDCGIRVDKPEPEKQIKYYTTMIQNYPHSSQVERWHEILGSIYLYDIKNSAAALKEYDYLTTHYKESDHYPIYLLVSAKLKRDKQLPVLENYRIIAGDFPKSEFAAEALYRMAEIYYSNQQFKEANQLYQRLLTEYYYTEYAKRARENLGNIYLASTEYDKAIQIFTDQIKDIALKDVVLRRQNVSNEIINSIFNLGKAYYLKNDWKNARKNLSLYLNITNEGIFRNEAYLLLGDTYYEINDKNSAIDSYSHVEKSDSLIYQNSLKKLAKCQFEISNYSDAAKTYKLLMKATPSQEIFSQYIISLIRNGEQKQANTAIKTFKKKYKKEKNYLAGFDFEQGEYLRKLKKFNAALKFFKKVKNDYGKTDYVDNAAYHEALIYITMNKQKEALDILASFSSSYPNSDQMGAVLNTLGGIYFRSEKYESAVISFKNALKKSLPSELRRQVMSNLIKTYKFINFWDAVLALSRDYIDEYPDADDIIDKQITISQSYVNLNQFDRAIELLRKARIEADSEKEPEIQFYIGEAYLKAGQYESAIAEFVKIPLLSRKTKLQWEASALYYSGQAYEKLGRIDEAIRMYQEIVKRPGIDLILKKDAKKRIEKIKG